MKNRKKTKTTVKVMQTYVKIVEAEVLQFMKENGFLVTDNIDLRETNAVLSEALMIVIRFLKESKDYDGEAFKQYILTIENERLKRTLEMMSKDINLEGNGAILMKRPKQKNSPYTNPPIIFDKK